jgi:NTP pyrophosphatase (non-canonical NTP hydrolase)
MTYDFTAWDSYVLWTDATALDAANTLEYVQVGLAEETCELLSAQYTLKALEYGIAKRKLRGDGPDVLAKKALALAECRERVIDESGDVLWYVARYLRIRGISIAQMLYSEKIHDMFVMEDPATVHGMKTEALHCFARKFFEVCTQAFIDEQVFFLFLYMSDAIAAQGLELVDVIRRNKFKLMQRKADGTIKGSGEVR